MKIKKCALSEKFRAILVLFVVTGFLASCAMNQDFRQDNVEGKAFVRAYGVKIHSVNGEPYGVNTSRAVISPGTNEFVVSAEASNYQMLGNANIPMKITVQAEAGKDYAITGARGDRRLCAFPLLSETGQPDYSSPAGCY